MTEAGPVRAVHGLEPHLSPDRGAIAPGRHRARGVEADDNVQVLFDFGEACFAVLTTGFTGTAPRVTPEHACHVLDVMTQAQAAGRDGRARNVDSTFTPPVVSKPLSDAFLVGEFPVALGWEKARARTG